MKNLGNDVRGSVHQYAFEYDVTDGQILLARQDAAGLLALLRTAELHGLPHAAYQASDGTGVGIGISLYLFYHMWFLNERGN